MVITLPCSKASSLTSRVFLYICVFEVGSERVWVYDIDVKCECVRMCEVWIGG